MEVGTKVRLKRHAFRRAESVEIVPELDTVYTVRAVRNRGQEDVSILLNEIQNPKRMDPGVRWEEIAFDATRFEVVDDDE